MKIFASYLSERHCSTCLFSVLQVDWQGCRQLLSFIYSFLPHLQALSPLKLHLRGAFRVQVVKWTHQGLVGWGRTWTPVGEEGRKGLSGGQGWGSSGHQPPSEEPCVDQVARVQLQNLNYALDGFIRSAARGFKFSF